MKKYISLSALALAGAMLLTLTACGPKESASTPTPEVTETPSVAESVKPTETPQDSAQPQPSESANVVTPPESQAPVQSTPIQPEPVPSEAPSEAPAEESKVQAVWTAISNGMELPYLMDLDSELLSSLYGINTADLVDYVAKLPEMNVQATEFFIAQVQPGKMDTVKSAIAKRQADMETEWSQYLPEQLELVQNYKLVTNGDYVMFCVAVEADTAVSYFNDCTK